MIALDFILLGIILVVGFLGFKRGFLESLGSIFGIVIATIIASRFYPGVASWFGDSNLSNIIAFIIIFSLTVKLVSILFWVLGKLFQIVTVLPFVSSFDRLLGLILGIVEGILILAVVLNFFLKFPINEWMITQMSESVVSRVLLKIGFVFVPLFPEAVKKLKSFM
jgi:membrane protein required for colicin V production